jgi:acyl carrier protein
MADVALTGVSSPALLFRHTTLEAGMTVHIGEAAQAARKRIRAYIIDNLMLGHADGLDDDASLLESGILDSTGAIEMVAFLETAFAITIADHELVAENLDSVARIAAFVESKLAGN